MTTNATVEARHKDEAAKAYQAPQDLADYLAGNAQLIANLEAARAENADLTNRLAGIDRIARERGWHNPEEMSRFAAWTQDIAALASGHTKVNYIGHPELGTPDPASGHTPSPCPHCAAKDEAMAAFKSDVSENVIAVRDTIQKHAATKICDDAVEYCLNRFIIPPADPVAEALKAAWTKLWPEDTGIPTACQALRDELAKHGLELSRLGGAK